MSCCRAHRRVGRCRRHRHRPGCGSDRRAAPRWTRLPSRGRLERQRPARAMPTDDEHVKVVGAAAHRHPAVQHLPERSRRAVAPPHAPSSPNGRWSCTGRSARRRSRSRIRWPAARPRSALPICRTWRVSLEHALARSHGDRPRHRRGGAACSSTPPKRSAACCTSSPPASCKEPGQSCWQRLAEHETWRSPMAPAFELRRVRCRVAEPLPGDRSTLDRRCRPSEVAADTKPRRGACRCSAEDARPSGADLPLCRTSAARAEPRRRGTSHDAPGRRSTTTSTRSTRSTPSCSRSSRKKARSCCRSCSRAARLGAPAGRAGGTPPPACAPCTRSRAARAWPARCAWARWRTAWKPRIEHLAGRRVMPAAADVEALQAALRCHAAARFELLRAAASIERADRRCRTLGAADRAGALDAELPAGRSSPSRWQPAAVRPAPQPVASPQPRARRTHAARPQPPRRRPPTDRLDPLHRRGAGRRAAGRPTSRRSARSAVRVRAPLLDRLVNQAGEVSITRSRIESDVGQIKGSLWRPDREPRAPARPAARHRAAGRGADDLAPGGRQGRVAGVRPARVRPLHALPGTDAHDGRVGQRRGHGAAHAAALARRRPKTSWSRRRA